MTETPPPASAQVERALEDGRVSIDEYDAAFRSYVACMKAEGFSVVESAPDNNGTINYGVSEEAVRSGADERCYSTEYGPVDAAYQIANEDTSSSAEELRECLRAHGLEPKETMKELLVQIEEAQIDIASC